MADQAVKRLRVLIPTSRHLYRLVSYGMVIDFENAVAKASDADFVAVPMYSRRAQVQDVLGGNLRRSVRAPRSRYDVCLLVAMNAYWLPSIQYVRNLRTIADRVVVYLFDSWTSDLAKLRTLDRVWSLVDELFVSFSHSVEEYAAHLPCRLHYLPQAIEPRWFHTQRRAKPIDVLSVGRRLPMVHHALLELSRSRDLFYFYQTHVAPQAIDLSENQELLGRLCRSARVHVSWSVDRTNPERLSEKGAITARWFESAASGAVVIGSAPATQEFQRLFPYPGFVRELDADPARTEEALDAALDDRCEDERLALAEHVRRTHTWAGRWHEILGTL
jgi:Glycosyl transferases group 1